MGYDDRNARDDDRYGRGRDYGRDQGRAQGDDRDDRGFFDRAGDEVRSWFGDDEAERRRRYDERDEGRDDGSRRYGREEFGRRDQGGAFGPAGRDRARGYGGDRYGSSSYGGQATGQDAARDRDRDVSGYGWGGRSQSDRGQPDRGQTSFGRSQGQEQQRHAHDDNYRSWRDRQMQSFDRDYDEYRRDNQSKFENEFSTYRTRREGQRAIVSQAQEHQEVIGSDGQHVGTVDHIRGDRILLTKTDPAAGGKHHTIPSSWVDNTEDGKVKLTKTAEEAKKAWREERDDDDKHGGGLFGQKNRDDNRDFSSDHNLDRSFSGTY